MAPKTNKKKNKKKSAPQNSGPKDARVDTCAWNPKQFNAKWSDKGLDLKGDMDNVTTDVGALCYSQETGARAHEDCISFAAQIHADISSESGAPLRAIISDGTSTNASSVVLNSSQFLKQLSKTDKVHTFFVGKSPIGDAKAVYEKSKERDLPIVADRVVDLDRKSGGWKVEATASSQADSKETIQYDVAGGAFAYVGRQRASDAVPAEEIGKLKSLAGSMYFDIDRTKDWSDVSSMLKPLFQLDSKKSLAPGQFGHVSECCVFVVVTRETVMTCCKSSYTDEAKQEHTRYVPVAKEKQKFNYCIVRAGGEKKSKIDHAFHTQYIPDYHFKIWKDIIANETGQTHWTAENRAEYLKAFAYMTENGSLKHLGHDHGALSISKKKTPKQKQTGSGGSGGGKGSAGRIDQIDREIEKIKALVADKKGTKETFEKRKALTKERRSLVKLGKDEKTKPADKKKPASDEKAKQKTGAGRQTSCEDGKCTIVTLGTTGTDFALPHDTVKLSGIIAGTSKKRAKIVADLAGIPAGKKEAHVQTQKLYLKKLDEMDSLVLQKLQQMKTVTAASAQASPVFGFKPSSS